MYDPSVVKKARALIKEGASTKEVCDQTGVSRSTLNNWLRKKPIRGKRKTNHTNQLQAVEAIIAIDMPAEAKIAALRAVIRQESIIVPHHRAPSVSIVDVDKAWSNPQAFKSHVDGEPYQFVAVPAFGDRYVCC